MSIVSAATPPEVIKLLAHSLRWQLVQALAISDYRVNELVHLVDQPINLVSYHLKQLRLGQMVTTRRSDADGRDVYYSLNVAQLRSAYYTAGAALHPMLAQTPPSRALHKKPSVLFICTHNSARSQMAEGLLRHLSADELVVNSAGSIPDRVHPDAITTMARRGIDIERQHAKGFDAVRGESFGVVITVCDQAREICPTFPATTQQIHWGFSDPSRISDEQERRRAFKQTADGLQARIEHFLHSLQMGAIV